MAKQALTYNITDCCILQIIMDGSVFKEFYLNELRVLDTNSSFKIFDSLSALDFSNYAPDFTAADLRIEVCTCING